MWDYLDPSENFGLKIVADACDSLWWELKWFELSEICLLDVWKRKMEIPCVLNHVHVRRRRSVGFFAHLSTFWPQKLNDVSLKLSYLKIEVVRILLKFISWSFWKQKMEISCVPVVEFYLKTLVAQKTNLAFACLRILRTFVLEFQE